MRATSARTPGTRVPLPTRPGPRPCTTDETPHTQLDQQPVTNRHLERVLRQARTWPGVSDEASGISVPGARALVLSEELAVGPPEAFVTGREFAHGHAGGDHSLHLALPLAVARAVEDAGWAEPHFLAAAGVLPRTLVMLYAPRDTAEVAMALAVVRASYDFARGAPEALGTVTDLDSPSDDPAPT